MWGNNRGVIYIAGAFLLAAATVSSAQADDTLVSKNSSWKYLDDGSNQGTAWRASVFDDSGWAPGPGVLGFGDVQDTLINNHIPPGAISGSVTWYFRHNFDVADPSLYEGIKINVLRDDGAVVYLNGNEIYRAELPSGTIDYDTQAGTTDSETTYFPSGGLCKSLNTGTNVLAVEVHQTSYTSSDISFDLELIAVANFSETARGPYLQNQTPTSVTIRWSTICASNSRIKWGSSVGNLTNIVDDAGVGTDHEVEITGLTPGATIFYSVGSTTQVLAGDDADHFFVMPPAHGTVQKTRVWALGDSGTANSNAAAVRDAYYTFTGATHTDLWLMLGDNAYGDGTDPQYQAAVFDMYPQMLRKSALWPLVGNHDDRSANSLTESGVYYDIFTLPDEAATDGAGSGVDSGTEAYYSFDFANIHFIVMESDETNGTFRSDMVTWLTADIAATTAVWVVAVWHHPSYTMGSHNSDNESQLIYMRENILPILEAGGVDLALTGHSHSYERSYLIDGHYGNSDSFVLGTHALDNGDGSPTGDGAYGKVTGQVPHRGAVYIVAGSSGKTSDDDANAPHEAMRNMLPLQVLGSVVLDVDDNIMDVTFLSGTGTVDDSFRIVKQPDGDSDTVADVLDNCPSVANPGQEDLDSDGEGDVCDDDVDGDGLSNDVDLDDDNDGLADADEPGMGADPFDPDSDDDGIVDGLDRIPDSGSNVLDTCVSHDATLNVSVSAPPMTCAATNSVTTIPSAGVTATGDLLIITPSVTFGPGFYVDAAGILTVISADPTVPVPAE